MSNLISEKDIKDFEEMESLWLVDEGLYADYWDKKLEDEDKVFEWARQRFEQTSNQFAQLTGLQGQFYSKLIDMLMEALMTGFFFGELRWNKDIREMLETALG